MQSLRNKLLYKNLKELYASHQEELLFHGWHHITFVTRKALEFSAEFKVDLELLEAAALTHDLNYIVDTTSAVDDGKILRIKELEKAGYSPSEIESIEQTVHESSTENRDADISNLAKALSDADALFKVLPVGPMILSSRFISETKVDLRKWADRILREQQPLLDQGIYFYTDIARKRYLDWAKLNLQWVTMVRDSLDDSDVQVFLDDCKALGFL